MCLHKFFTFNFRSLMLCCCTHAGFGVPPIPDIPTFEPPLVSLKKLCSGTFMRHTHTHTHICCILNFSPTTATFIWFQLSSPNRCVCRGSVAIENPFYNQSSNHSKTASAAGALICGWIQALSPEALQKQVADLRVEC